MIKEHNIRVAHGNCLLSRDVVLILLGISNGTLSNWMSSDDPPPYNSIEQKYPAKELGEWIRQRQTIRVGQGGGHPWLPQEAIMKTSKAGTNGRDYQTERTRKEAATADKIELDLAIKRGDVVLAADVEKGWSDLLSRLKVRLLRAPYTIAAQLTGETDQVRMQSGAKDIIEDALIELSEDWKPQEEEQDAA